MARLPRPVRLSILVVLGFGTLLPASANPAGGPPLAETPRPAVGHDSVAAALADLRAQPDVVFTTENGWLIATDEAAYTIWSFAPEGYPAHPAVVKRQVLAQPVGSAIEMSVLCEAPKAACDDLVRTFAEMNGLPLPPVEYPSSHPRS